MSDWSEFTLAFVVFFVSHSLPVRPQVKARIVAIIGARGFSFAYSLLSIAVLTWLIVATGRAPFVELWARAPWQTYVPLILMAAASVVLGLSLGRPNPLSFGGMNNATFDPAQPGIVGWMRHPLLVAIGLWAGAHMLPNGDLAHVVLFGVFLAFAGLGTRIIDRRKRRQLGADWDRLSNTRRQVKISAMGGLRVVVGLGIYCLLLWLHTPVIGINPLP